MKLTHIGDRLDLGDVLWWHGLHPSKKLALLSVAHEHLELLNEFLDKLTSETFDELFAEIAEKRGTE